MDMETQQVRMRLTADKEAIAALHSRHVFQKDEKNRFFIPVMFNSQEIRFYLNDVKTLGRDTAHSIYRRSTVIVGDQLTGDVKPMFDIVEEFDLSTSIEDKLRFACPECGKDQGDGRTLAEHLSEHFAEPEAESGDGVDHEEAGEPVLVETLPAPKNKYFSRKATERTVAE
jgi:hypothetical protein